VGRVEVRPATAADAQLLFSVYRAGRWEELATGGLDAAAIEALLAQQWGVECATRDVDYPGHVNRSVLVERARAAKWRGTWQSPGVRSGGGGTGSSSRTVRMPACPWRLSMRAAPRQEEIADAQGCSAGQTGGATLGDVMRGKLEALNCSRPSHGSRARPAPIKNEPSAIPVK
jgi:hypothetical protein